MRDFIICDNFLLLPPLSRDAYFCKRQVPLSIETSYYFYTRTDKRSAVTSYEISIGPESGHSESFSERASRLIKKKKKKARKLEAKFSVSAFLRPMRFVRGSAKWSAKTIFAEANLACKLFEDDTSVEKSAGEEGEAGIHVRVRCLCSA